MEQLLENLGSRGEDRFGIVGKTVARTYRVESLVAEGGFGVVYRAEHQGFRAKVALKCLKIPSDLTQAQRRQFLEQFRSEAEVLFRLSSKSQHIVRPLHIDAFESERGELVPFIALEWLDGRSLAAALERRRLGGKPPLGLARVVELLTPVAQALELAHHLPGENGQVLTVVHRDLKPENLFVCKVGSQDELKILDFGISKVKSAAGQLAGRASQTGESLGAFSPAYGAPEQWVPKRYGQTGRWTDVWGLALTVVEAARGQDVIVGDQAAMMGTILDPNRRPTPRHEGLVVSDRVERIFERALAVDPTQRYATVGEFWDQLTQALGLRVAAISSRPQLQAHGRPGERQDVLDTMNPPPVIADLRRELGSRPGTPERIFPEPARLEVELAKVSVRPAARATPENSYRKPARPNLLKSLSPALSLLVLSLAASFLDRVYVKTQGVQLALGPLKLGHLAIVILLLALASGVRVLIRYSDS